jgi:aspartate/methionine/tyrosine aminotransferase
MRPLNTFKLEEYLSDKEHRARYLLCCSDAESMSLQNLLALADAQMREVWEQVHLGYVEVRGSENVRTEIATLYPELSGQDVICFAGAQEALFCTLKALIAPQDEVITFSPCYQSLKELPWHFGATVFEVPLREEECWQLDLQRVTDTITPRTKAIVLNFPHNPCGSLLSATQFDGLIALARQHGIYLISDEVFRLLGPSHVTWLPPLATQYERAVSIGVMSKAFGLGGVRVGWAVSQDAALLNRMEQVKHYTSIANGATDEVLAVIALRARETILRRNREIIDHNLTVLDDFLHRHQDAFSWVRPQAGCIGLIHAKRISETSRLAHAILQAEGVLLMPGTVCGVADHYFRIGFGRANMPEALSKFERFIEHYQQ